MSSICAMYRKGQSFPYAYQLIVYMGRLDGHTKMQTKVWRVPEGLQVSEGKAKAKEAADLFETEVRCSASRKKELASFVFNIEYPAQVAGVYALIRNKEVVYIGESLNVFKRVADHLRGKDNRKSFDSYVVLDVPAEKRKWGEQYLIDLYHPIYNHQNNDIRNDRRGFRQAYRDYDPAYFNSLFFPFLSKYPMVSGVTT